MRVVHLLASALVVFHFCTQCEHMICCVCVVVRILVGQVGVLTTSAYHPLRDRAAGLIAIGLVLSVM